MKRRIITCFLIIISLLAVTSCSTFSNWKKKKPAVKVQSLDIKTISFDDITLGLKIEIENPYPIGIKIERIELETLVGGKQLFRIDTLDKFEISAKGKKENQLDINLIYDDMLDVYSDYMTNDYVDLTVNVQVDVRLPEIPGLPEIFEIPVSIQRHLPTIKPVIRLKNFDVDLPSKNEVQLALNKVDKNPITRNIAFARVMAVLLGKNDSSGVKTIQQLDLIFRVKFDIEVENLAKTRLQFADFNYRLKINETDFMSGVTNDVRYSGQISTIRINNEFSARKLNSSLIEAITAGKNKFYIEGNAILLLPEEISKKPVNLKFSGKGDVAKK
ncbi:MAG: LEA type 2 family protein [Spirochaetes bacterium]|nr:LEA type 2 family protein [Spirochaetota bacterium]